MTEAAGYWWLEDSPDNKVAGVLRLSNEGKYSLKTIGSLAVNGLADDASSIDVSLFGNCQGTLYTIPRASLWHITDHSVGDGPKGSVETWESFLMIRGTHLCASEVISSMTFGLSGLSTLWDRWTSNTKPDERIETGDAVVLKDKSQIVLFQARSSQSGLGRRSYQDHIRVQVTPPSALPLEDFEERFIYPLQILVSAITGKPSETLDQHGTLPNESGEPRSGNPTVFDINPWKTVDDETHRSYGSLLIESDPFFPGLVSAWLNLAEKLIRAMAVSAPSSTRGFVESETFAAVGAAEQIQRSLTPSMPTPFAESVLKKLAEHATTGGLNSAERRKIVHVLRQMEFTLEQRLISLTQCDDDGLFEWFLHGHIAEWAKVTAYVRNQLGHGLTQLDGTTAYVELMVEVGDAARNVTMLRLLIECGYPPNLLRQRLQSDRYWSWHQEKGQQWPKFLLLLESKN